MTRYRYDLSSLNADSRNPVGVRSSAIPCDAIPGVSRRARAAQTLALNVLQLRIAILAGPWRDFLPRAVPRIVISAAVEAIVTFPRENTTDIFVDLRYSHSRISRSRKHLANREKRVENNLVPSHLAFFRFSQLIRARRHTNSLFPRE